MTTTTCSDLSLELLVELVSCHTAIPHHYLRIQRRPTGKFNTSYFVSGTPRLLVLRIAPADDPSDVLFYEHRMMRQELAVHELLRDRTTVPVPAIIANDTSRRLLDRDYLMMERLPGVPLSKADLDDQTTEAVLREIGQCLRQTHALTSSRYGYQGPHWPMSRRRAGPMLLSSCGTGCSTTSCAAAVINPKKPTRCADCWTEISVFLTAACRPPCCTWTSGPKNILVDRGHLTGLIDWDRALWGDPEIEFAVLDYCGISGPAFWDGYGCQRDRSAEAEMRRVFYLLYKVQKYIFIRRVRNQAPARADRYRHQAFVVARQLMRE